MTKYIDISLYDTGVLFYYREKENEKIKVPTDVIRQYHIDQDQLKELDEIIDNDEYKYSTLSINNLQIIIIDGVNLKSGKYLFKFVTHEALHATFAIANMIGLKYTTDSEESFTYLLDYIVGEIYTLLKKQIEFFVAKENLNKQLGINDNKRSKQ